MFDKKKWSKEYWPKWYQKNKKKRQIYIKQYYKKWYQKNIKKVKECDMQKYQRNKEKIKRRRKENYNPILSKEKRRIFLKSWEGYIPKQTTCQICNRKIYFNRKEKVGKHNVIHFDHKKEDILIKESPSCWLARNLCTIKNQKIWESCDFGKLCIRCNILLPVKNREQIVKNIVKYVLKEYKLCKI